MKLQRIRGTADLYNKDINRFNHVVSFANSFEGESFDVSFSHITIWVMQIEEHDT